jgi:ATP-binding cassette subfamily F protein 3
MLVLNNIHFHFGARDMYHDTSWHIKPNEKIGLIGANGTGKSTLLRIINGEFELAAGSITKRKDLSIGFLNQDLLSYDSQRPIIEVAMEAFAEQNRLSEEIQRMLVQLETDHSEPLLHRLHDAQVRFEALDGSGHRPNRCLKDWASAATTWNARSMNSAADGACA